MDGARDVCEADGCTVLEEPFEENTLALSAAEPTLC